MTISRTDPFLVADDASVAASVDDLCASLRTARAQVEEQHEKVGVRHSAIRDLTTSEDFSHELNIPARSLFATLTLPELLQGSVAVDRQRAVSEQTETLKAELQQMQQHRDLIVSELLTPAADCNSRPAYGWSRNPSDPLSREPLRCEHHTPVAKAATNTSLCLESPTGCHHADQAHRRCGVE